MDKTVVVLVERIVKHQLYKKYVKRHKKYKAHDEANECRIGDRVLITEGRPSEQGPSAFRVSAIVEKSGLIGEKNYDPG